MYRRCASKLRKIRPLKDLGPRLMQCYSPVIEVGVQPEPTSSPTQASESPMLPLPTTPGRAFENSRTVHKCLTRACARLQSSIYPILSAPAESPGRAPRSSLPPGRTLERRHSDLFRSPASVGIPHIRRRLNTRHKLKSNVRESHESHKPTGRELHPIIAHDDAADE